MFWVLLTLLVALPFVVREAGRRRALAGKEPKALPGPPVGLRVRLAGVDAAIEGVRAALSLMTPPMAMASAALALRRTRAASDRSLPDLPFDGPGEAGPATQQFEALLRELDRLDEADLRDLADAGLERARIVAALAAGVAPERWGRDLVSVLDYWQDTVANLRDGAGYR